MVRNNIFTHQIWFILFEIMLGLSVVRLFFFTSIESLEFMIGMLIINIGLHINGFVSFK